jgi:hypothetical protein
MTALRASSGLLAKTVARACPPRRPRTTPSPPLSRHHLYHIVCIAPAARRGRQRRWFGKRKAQQIHIVDLRTFRVFADQRLDHARIILPVGRIAQRVPDLDTSSRAIDSAPVMDIIFHGVSYLG